MSEAESRELFEMQTQSAQASLEAHQRRVGAASSSSSAQPQQQQQLGRGQLSVPSAGESPESQHIGPSQSVSQQVSRRGSSEQQYDIPQDINYRQTLAVLGANKGVGKKGSAHLKSWVATNLEEYTRDMMKEYYRKGFGKGVDQQFNVNPQGKGGKTQWIPLEEWQGP